jgi:hypothetical protein
MNDIEIVNKALPLIGSDPIETFQDDSNEALVSGQLYDLICDALLSRYEWKFTRTQKALSRVDSAPLYGFQCAYQLPTDLLELKSTESLADYQIVDDKLYSSQSSVNITYQIKRDESRFPAYFRLALVYKLASLFALSIAEDEKKHTLYDKLYTTALSEAKTLDSKQEPTKGPRHEGSLITTRYH